MAKTSILQRLAKLERKRRFVDWFVMERFWATLRLEELETYLSDGSWPDPIPHRPSSLDVLDRNNLINLWKESESTFGGRSHDDREFFIENGFWPEQRGRLRYSMPDGKLFVEWRNETGVEDAGTESAAKQPLDKGGHPHQAQG